MTESKTPDLPTSAADVRAEALREVDISNEAVQEALYLLEEGEPNEVFEDQKKFIIALASERDRLRAIIDTPAPQTVQEAVEVSIQTMRLSDNREEYYVRIACGGRTIETRRYTQGFRNRAEYEVDELRHVLLNAPKPDLMDPKYADDPAALRALSEQANTSAHSTGKP